MGSHREVGDIVRYISQLYPTSSIALSYTRVQIPSDPDLQDAILKECFDFFEYEILGIYNGDIEPETWKVLYDILRIIRRNDEIAPFDQAHTEDLIHALDTICGTHCVPNKNHMGLIKFILREMSECGIVEYGASLNELSLTALGKILMDLLEIEKPWKTV